MLFVNPHIFFQLENGEAIVWDYRNHQQYSLEPAYIERLMAWSRGIPLQECGIDEELLEANLLVSTPPTTEEWGWDILSHIFHRGTQDLPLTLTKNPDPDTWIEEYLDFCDEIIDDQPNLFTEREGKIIDLPTPDLSALAKDPFLSVLRRRQTCRVFKGNSMPLEYLSTLLFSSFGLLHGEWTELSEKGLSITGMRKASASGGGLHPEEAYVIALRVDGLIPGLYHYRVQDHKLTLLTEGKFEEKLIELLYHQYFARGLSVGIFITARFDKAWWKYRHSRAYRNVLLDIGHASQTFQLCATSLGYQTWITGAFQDTAVDSFLGVNGSTEGAIFFVGAGTGELKAIDELTLRHLASR